jgi:putative NAD(P)-binding protein
MVPTSPDPKQCDARIAIIGAGAAGLSAAWFLKQQGFTNVTVFERYGRVGGLCFTINDGYRAFDLGGNYVTPAYRETRKIARAVGARTYRGEPYIGVRLPEHPGTEPLRYVDMREVVREVRDENGTPTRILGWIPFGLATLRYVVERWKVREVIDQPTFAHVHEHPELCVTFGEWLRARSLEGLRSLFEIPITMMGYGDLDEIAAPYALKYMSLGTFIAMCLREAPFVGFLCPWPRRFEFGFQRMWEAVGWRLNVRNDVVITDIWRLGDPPPPDGEAPSDAHPIRIDLTYPARIFQRDERIPFTRWFDHLIVASARVGALNDAFHLEPGARETRLREVDTYGFSMTTMHPEGDGARTFRLRRPVVCVLPFRHEGKDQRPWVVVQLWPDDTPMLQCYSRLAEPNDARNQRAEVIRGAERLLQLLGGRRAGSSDPHGCRWEHYEQWPYFGHVGPEDFARGFFRDLEDLQGHRNTYWVGGFTNFELIEAIVSYAKALVEKHFVPVHAATRFSDRSPSPSPRDAIVFGRGDDERRRRDEPASGDVVSDAR